MSRSQTRCQFCTQTAAYAGIELLMWKISDGRWIKESEVSVKRDMCRDHYGQIVEREVPLPTRSGFAFGNSSPTARQRYEHAAAQSRARRALAHGAESSGSADGSRASEASGRGNPRAAGPVRTTTVKYVARCWNCNRTIVGLENLRCPKCSMFACRDCGECMCNYRGGR